MVSERARLRLRSRGHVSVTVVIRIPFGGGIGAVEHHSESPEAYFAHTAGLRVVACAEPQDAYMMIQQAVTCEDPVIFFEPKQRYWDRGEVDVGQDVAQARPLGRAKIVVPGTAVTVVAYGPAVKTSVRAAAAARDDGHSAEGLDPRSLPPFDGDTGVGSAERTARG